VTAETPAIVPADGVPSAIVVRYIYSACIKTITPDVSVLHDPWFTEGVYDGSWFQYPRIRDPISATGDCDLIYVTHVHPDHYDPLFLRQYFDFYGEKEIIIADHTPNHLAGKMKADGLKCTVLRDVRKIRNTSVHILPHKTGSISDIDSAIIVKFFDGRRQHCVVNTNDIIFDGTMVETVKKAGGDVDVLLCGYTGAGPYPQTYFDAGDPRLAEAAERKKIEFFERYRALTQAIGAKINIPFAGQYILGGKLVSLNDSRGVADAVEVLDLDRNAVVLADNGGSIDTLTCRPTAVRTEKYASAAIASREEEIKGRLMDYERLIAASETKQLPLRRLLTAAARKAHEKTECETDYYFVFPLPEAEFAIVNANKSAPNVLQFVSKDAILPEPRSEIDMDPRYLFGLLTHVYHWNNAEVGSQYNTRRTPNVLNRSAQSFLNYLTV
jgi:UDP-MurNAc hydroxylase